MIRAPCISSIVVGPEPHQWKWKTTTCSSYSSLSLRCSSSCSAFPQRNSLRCAVLGAGFAGLSVAWHLLRHSPKELKLDVEIFDDVGIGGGASGVAGGLIHPYSPKDSDAREIDLIVKPLWRGEQCWRECLHLLSVAEAAAAASVKSTDDGRGQTTHDYIVRRRGILRPAANKKNLDVMHENAQYCLTSCQIKTLNEIATRNLIPNFCSPLNTAFFMPEAVNINPQNYLQALFLACENFVRRMSSTGFQGKSISLHKKFVASLHELDDHYDAVIVCLGARVDMLPELSGVLPLRTCRGIVTHMQLLDVMGEDFPDHSPSILSDAWIAVQGPRSLHMGSTWEWGSRNYASCVCAEEASRALQELLPKARIVYPQITGWTVTGAQAGLRAMPPLSQNGSFPLLGCIDDLIGECEASKYWLIGGLGARGLLYHGWFGKLTAQALLSCDEDIIPPELRSWKNTKRK